MIQVISIHTLGSYVKNLVGKIIELTEKNSFLLLSQNIKYWLRQMWNDRDDILIISVYPGPSCKPELPTTLKKKKDVSEKILRFSHKEG